MKRGFTLIELMIVVGIMLILATIGFSSYIFSLQKSHDVQRKNDLGTIAKGIQAFNNDFGHYPLSDNGRIVGCDYNDGGLIDCAWGQPLAAFVNHRIITYIGKLPSDPDTTQSYFYESDATGSTFNIYAALENTSDQSYHSDLAISCGVATTCNYELTESGVK